MQKVRVKKQAKAAGKAHPKVDCRPGRIVKKFKSKKLDSRTPRVADRMLNSKSANKQSNPSLPVKPATGNSSFCAKPGPKASKLKQRGNKSSSSSPEIRASPHEASMSKTRSNTDFAPTKPKPAANKNSKSFIDSLAKRELANCSWDKGKLGLKYSTVGSLNGENFKSMLTRNPQKTVAGEKSTESILKDGAKAKPIIGIT